MKTFSEFLIERRKAGKLSGILATLALLVHGGKEAYKEITNPGHLRRDISSNPHYLKLTGIHPHGAGGIITPNSKEEEEKNKEEENVNSTRRP